MIYVTLATLALLGATLAGFVGLLRSQQHAHTRREDQLLNQLLHAVGKPWLPAPASEPRPEPEIELLAAAERWTPSPEQVPY